MTGRPLQTEADSEGAPWALFCSHFTSLATSIVHPFLQILCLGAPF